jgi:hypothetical protein
MKKVGLCGAAAVLILALGGPAFAKGDAAKGKAVGRTLGI